jgi:ArsR family transcriptional regulator
LFDSFFPLLYNHEYLSNYSSFIMLLKDHTSNHLADLFSALSDPTRLRIISLLIEGERNVGELAAQLEMTESAISHQLRGLRQLRIVRSRKEGRQVYYALDDDHVARLYRLGLDHVEHG